MEYYKGQHAGADIDDLLDRASKAVVTEQTDNTIEDVETLPVVLYAAQNLTDEQKSQARMNIEAYHKPDNGIPKNHLSEEVLNLLNVAQSSIPIIEFASTSIALDANKYYRLTLAQEGLQITLNTPSDANIKNEYFIEFPYTSGSVSFPADIMWENGETPTFEEGKTYQVSIVNNLAMYAVFG